jgi:hypothetical protein
MSPFRVTAVRHAHWIATAVFVLAALVLIVLGLPGKSLKAEQDAGIPADWLARATDEIQRSEYNLSPAGEDAYSAPNRAHGLRARFDPSGVCLTPRTPSGGTWKLGMRLDRFGRDGALRDVPAVSPSAEGNRVEFRRTSLGINEWYVNDERGLEQGFTIHQSAPRGTDEMCPLVLEMTLNEGLHAQAGADGQTVLFMDDSGEPVLRYADLVVRDDAGRNLPAQLALFAEHIQIRIDDEAAEYPIIVDPLVTIPSWFQEGNQDGCLYGCSVATAGDVNGDGFSDVLIGAPTYGNGAGECLGRVFLYIGGAAGPAVVSTWIAHLNVVGGEVGEFGQSVASAGDVNGDGYDDIIIGAPEFSDDDDATEGHAYVWLGGPSGGGGGTSGLGPSGTAANADWEAESNNTQANFGQSVAHAGDVNGDGYSDIIIGAPGYDDGLVDEGWAFVWFGGAYGLGYDGTPANADWSAQSNSAYAALGWSVATAGDVNADGYDDVIIGAPGAHGALVWLGSVTGLGASGTPLNADWSADGGQGSFGKCVATAGDVDADGYSDVIIGAPGYTNGSSTEGAAFLWMGSASDLGANGTPANADWSREGNQTGAEYGWSVATLGDVDGDGFADVIVGAHLYTNGQNNEGRAYGYLGSGSGLSTSSFWIVEGNAAESNLGQSVAAAGDVNGDGFSDAIVGAWTYSGDDSDEGAAYLYFGSGSAPEGVAAWVGEGNVANAHYGAAVACAGDINGDGYSDAIVGAPNFDGGQANEGKVFVYAGQSIGLSVNSIWTAESNQSGGLIGTSVASAGDVNHDGYGDVIIGAPEYDDGVQADEGWAFVWFGSATGFGANGIPSNADWSVQGDQGTAHLGVSVASAGDVNGDGYGDVIVGASQFDNGQADEGRAYVYHGSAQGLSQDADWIAERDQADERLGSSVASAGDVNGDGFSDVIIGAPYFDGGNVDEGRAWVYQGSALGLASTVAWTGNVDQNLTGYGASVATAGDVNADGYSDVIVGAWRYDQGQVDEGLAFVYQGSASGLSSVAAWTAESNQADAHFGCRVASAGDVNGDGFSDVIVGAHVYDGSAANTGSAFVWLGGPAGLGANGTPVNADWSDDGSQGGAQAAEFGSSVASAGDVNGDGFADLIIGASFYADPSASEGAAFCFYGNDGNGMDRAALQIRSDNTAPIYLLGFSDQETTFRLKARGRSAGGRARVRLEWEVKPLGVLFDGTGLGQGSDAFDTGSPGTQGSVVVLNELAGGLAADNVYRWRARVTTDSPLFPHGPWLSPPYNAASEADFRTISMESAAPDPVSEGTRLRLAASRPNPFSRQTAVSYIMPSTGAVRLEVLDVQGRRVKTLVEGVQDAGSHSAIWDGRNAEDAPVGSGIYFTLLTMGTETRTAKLMLIRR